MQKTDKAQICFVPEGAKVLLCNAIDRDGDGQLWETKSGKWIPIPLDEGVTETATTPEEQ